MILTMELSPTIEWGDSAVEGGVALGSALALGNRGDGFLVFGIANARGWRI
jgi:hypothetical protein